MARFGARTLTLTFPLTKPRKTAGPFWFSSQSHEKMEKETLRACAVLSELQKAYFALADCSRLHKKGIVELKKFKVRDTMTPLLICASARARVLAALPIGALPTVLRPDPCSEESRIACNIFLYSQNKGLRGQWLHLCGTSF